MKKTEEDVYLVDFPFGGKAVQAEATFVADRQILIGAHLLREYRLQADFVSKTLAVRRQDKYRCDNGADNTHRPK